MTCCKIGEYKCSVKIESELYDKSQYVDKCLKNEIEYLHKKGIKTMASCCGHKITDSVIGVSDNSVKIMLKLNYKVFPKYESTFYSKTKII
jgi:hypothetical protein